MATGGFFHLIDLVDEVNEIKEPGSPTTLIFWISTDGKAIICTRNPGNKRCSWKIENESFKL